MGSASEVRRSAPNRGAARPAARRDAGNPPMLLTCASAHGTLAAVRCLGRAGIPVTVADPGRLQPAGGSRFATRYVRCPPVEDTGAFVAWLDAFARKSPAHVLYPTSDSTAWVYALHRDALASRFRLRVPEADCVYALLNKRRLHGAARAAGLEVPVTRFPRDARELEHLLPELPYPVLLKPQTQILRSGDKGRCAADAAAARALWASFASTQRYGAALLERDPGVVTPMIQQLLVHRETELLAVSGYASADGALAVLGATKRLQRPRRIGVGVCFESAPVPAALSAGLRALCRAVGYHGVFEAEFARAGGRDLLIDFNPRFYGQMAFDIARGLPLPLLAYEAALGRDDAVRARLEATRAEAPGAPRAYAHAFGATLLLASMLLAGRLPAEDRRRWRAFLAAHRGRIFDAVHDWRDPAPTALAWVGEAWSWLRHPRSFVRAHFRDD